ncbi:MAG: sensor histidine kinase [Actinobacteria bacterium]|nr:sensor histidine kinase [Actinomycetota bacterium]
MFQTPKIRTKLILIIAAPLVALLVLSTLGARQRNAEAGASRADAGRIRLAEQAAAVANELQAESLFSVAFLSQGGAAYRPKLAAQRIATDRAYRALRATMATDASAQDRQTVSKASASIGFLPSLRGQTDSRDTDWYEIIRQYASIDDSVQSIIAGFVDEMRDPTLASNIQNAAALTAYESAADRTSTLLAGVLSEGGFRDSGATGGTGSSAGLGRTASDVRLNFASYAGTEDLQLGVFLQTATPTVRQDFRNAVAGSDVDAVRQVRLDALQPNATKLAASFTDFVRSVDRKTSIVRSFRSARFQALARLASDQASRANRASRLYLTAALLSFALSLVLAWVVAASITRPINRLTGAVDELAQDQLPRLVDSLQNPAEEDVSHLADSMAPIRDVGGSKEISHLAEAVNSIQRTAVDVATEQARLLRKGIGEMFVNLARRNQALLDRQIEFIDQLERDEEDPDQLENLFRLDHLATRQRRNAESLLVLAGAEPNRRRGRPVAMGDVVRAALGEVEDYGRIEIVSLDDVDVTSQSAPDIAHLLSELMENSAAFSPPETNVEVAGQRNADGYVLTITDHGIGMSAEQLAEANQLLAQPPLMGLSMSRSLGFIVIGRLSQRFGITVRLMASPSGGVTALVTVPEAVLVEDVPSMPEAAPAPTPVETRPVIEAVREVVDAPVSLAGTLEEAVPTGKAFDDALAALVDGETSASDDGRPREGLFGGGSSRPAGSDLPEPMPGEDVEPEPLPVFAEGPAEPNPFGATAAETTRLFGAPAPTATAAPAPRLFSGAAAEAEAPANVVSERTSTGLAKRAPRSGSTGRKLPGADTDRTSGAGATQRSPEEIRNMLSRFKTGQQQAKVGEAADGGPRAEG